MKNPFLLCKYINEIIQNVSVFFQLKKEFSTSALPQFPPKKLLSLTPAQLEDRRGTLERYIQMSKLH